MPDKRINTPSPREMGAPQARIFELVIELDAATTYTDVALALRDAADRIERAMQGVPIIPMPGHYPDGHSLRQLRAPGGDPGLRGSWGVRAVYKP